MVGVFAEPGFFTRKFLEMALRTLCPPLLQTLAQDMMALARLLNVFSAKCLAFTIGSQIDNAQINTERFIGGDRLRGGNSQRHRKIEGAVAIEQVCLSFDAPHTGLLIAPDQERHEYTTRKCQQGDGSQALKGHHTLIIDDSAFRLKGGLDALIALVGFTSLADAPNSQLSSKLVRGTKFTIHKFLQLKFVGCLLSKCYRSYIIGSRIECVHGDKQCLSLFSCRSEFQEHRLFHGTIVHPLIEVVNGLSPLRRRAIHPPLERRGFL